MKDKLAAIGSLLITAALSTCCTLPLALASLGLGSLSLGTLIHPVRPFMIGLAAAVITFGLFRVYLRPSTTKNRVLMWVSAAIFLVVVLTPYVVTMVRDSNEPPLVLEPGTRKMVVHIDNIEFAACCEGPAKTTLEALPGVRAVRINHLRKEAVMVVREEAGIDNAMISRALAAVDHTGHIKLAPPAESH
jgi:mercuric ion transport protein